ncbi:hypothetical protein L6278_03025 [Candidatus Parcubacteria bacterium]|nr:hypothetical protein [Candidatus Parcubacteria bacterium]
MEEKEQQHKNCLWADNSHKMAPNTIRGDVYLSIAQDLAQAVVVMESNYYDLLDDD